LKFSAYFADFDDKNKVKTFEDIELFAESFMKLQFRNDNEGFGRYDIFKTGGGWHCELYVKHNNPMSVAQAVAIMADFGVDKDYLLRRLQRDEFTLFTVRRGVNNRKWVWTGHFN